MDLFNKIELIKILEIPGVSLYHIDNNKQVKTVVKQGNLILGEFTDSNKTNVIILDQQQIPIYKELPFYVSEFQTFRSYVVPQEQFNISIQIDKKQDSLIQLFEQSLSQISTVLYNTTYEQELQKQQDEVNNNQVASLIKTGGNFISQGIKFGAQTAQKGITTTANYLKPAKQQQNVKISQETKNNIKKVQDSSGEVVQITHQGAKALIDIQTSVGKAAVDKIAQNTGQSSNKPLNPKLQYLKIVGQQSLASIVGILDSLDESAQLVGKATGESSKEVIQLRYGDDAAEVAQMGANTAGNAYGVYKDSKNVGVKAIAKNQGKVTAKEVGKKI